MQTVRKSHACIGVLFLFVFALKAICGRSGLYFEYIGKMLRLLFVPGCDIERLRTRLLTDLKLLPSMKNLIDKSELISKLQTLEGLTYDERSSLIGLLREHKKYGLVWEDKPEDVERRAARAARSEGQGDIERRARCL